MVTYDPVLAAALAAQPNKTAWSTTIATHLGNNRRLRCKRDASATATDPWNTGIEFLNVGSIGEITIRSGNVTGFGSLSDATISIDANLSTGSCVLRLEGNGHWLQGTLGLEGSSADFVMKSNFVGIGGVAYSAGIQAPVLMPSGTGPSAPAIDADAPGYVRIEDWSDPLAPVFLPLIPFDNRLPNWTFDDEEIASQMGDVRVTQSTKSAILADIEFGATLLSMNPIVNSVPGEVLHEVLIGCTPLATNWPKYPTLTGYNAAVTDTYPRPFKASIIKKDGVTVIYTHQMTGGAYDGLPINSPNVAIDLKDNDRPLGWHFHCGQMLPWRSRKPKLSVFAEKYFAGVETDVFRPAHSRFKTGYNMAHPIVGGSGNVNALGHWYATPKYPIAASKTKAFTHSDYYMWPMVGSNAEYAVFGVGNVGNPVTLCFGWGYNPGNPGLHDHYTGPGGVRSDRAIIPQTIAMYFSKPDYVRPLNNEPISELLDHWGLSYFNHPHHYLLNPKTFASIPHQEVYAGKWGYGKGTYYGGNDSYVSGGTDYTVPMFGIGSGTNINAGKQDKNGKGPWAYSSIDFLHNYSCPGWMALLCNDPMFAYSQKLRTHASIMAQLGGWGPTNSKPESHFLNRQHAWRFLHLGMMWKLASNHPLGVPRADVEECIAVEMDRIYDRVVVPASQPNPGGFFDALNNLGCYTQMSTPFVSSYTIDSANMAGLADNAIRITRVTNANGTTSNQSKELSVVLKYGKEIPVTSEFPLTVCIYDPAIHKKSREGHIAEVVGSDIANNLIFTRNPVPPEFKGSTYKVIAHPTQKRVIGSAGQMYYMGHCLQLWRQIGLFSVMRKKSPKYDAVFRYMIKCLDKFSIDWVIDTDGVAQSYWPISEPVLDDGTLTDVRACTSWAEHAQTYSKKVGVENFVTTSDGKNSDVDDVNEHNRAQWVFIRRDYFPEIPVERGEGALEQAVTMYRGYYNLHDARYNAYVAANPNNAYGARVAEWGARLPQLGILKKSNIIGDF